MKKPYQTSVALGRVSVENCFDFLNPIATRSSIVYIPEAFVIRRSSCKPDWPPASRICDSPPDDAGLSEPHAANAISTDINAAIVITVRLRRWRMRYLALTSGGA